MIMTAVIAALIAIIVPNLKNHFSNIKDFFIKIIFIKITLDTSENVTDVTTFHTIVDILFDEEKIVQFSRARLIDTSYKNRLGFGWHLCYGDFIYFLNYTCSEPLARHIETLNGYIEREPEVNKKIDLFVPFWNKSKIFEKLKNTKRSNTKSVEYCFRGHFNGPWQLHRHDLTYFDQNDVKKLTDTIIEMQNDHSNPTKFIMLSSKDNVKLLHTIAIDNGMDIVRLCDTDSGNVRRYSASKMCKNIADRNKPFIIHFDMANSEYDGNFSLYRHESSYATISKFLDTYIADKNGVVILDTDGYNTLNSLQYVEKEPYCEFEFVNRETAMRGFKRSEDSPMCLRSDPKFFNKINRYAKKLRVNKNDSM